MLEKAFLLQVDRVAQNAWVEDQGALLVGVVNCHLLGDLLQLLLEHVAVGFLQLTASPLSSIQVAVRLVQLLRFAMLQGVDQQI